MVTLDTVFEGLSELDARKVGHLLELMKDVGNLRYVIEKHRPIEVRALMLESNIRVAVVNNYLSLHDCLMYMENLGGIKKAVGWRMDDDALIKLDELRRNIVDSYMVGFRYQEKEDIKSLVDRIWRRI